MIIGKDLTEDISTTSLISAACKILSQVIPYISSYKNNITNDKNSTTNGKPN